MPAAAHSRLLDPATLAQIRDLRLLARTVVEGFLAGQHLDRRPASGVEFSQYRSYQPGDDPRRVDWRVYARSDRFFVREAEVERDVTVRFLLDASASMAHRDRPPQALAKLDYARFLVAALGYLVDLHGDRLALQILGGGGAPAAQRPARPPLALAAFLDRLERVDHLRPAGRWPAWEELAAAFAGQRRRELVVLVSDLYEERGEIAAALGRLAAVGHELLVLHLVARNELEFDLAKDFAGDLRFEDLETGERVLGNAAALRPGYLARHRQFLAGWRRRVLELGAGYELLPTDQPLDQALRGFLARRRLLP